jgi:membrane-associated protein
MEIVDFFKDLLLNLDDKLALWVVQYDTLIYAILFLIVFVETGLIVMPFLPGDSLLFTAGAIAAANNNVGLSIYVFVPLLIVAALCGDNLNYFVGHYFSEIIKKRERILFFKREYITKTESFYEKYGKQAIIMARFVPIVRTIAPFVAGAGSMPYRIYITFCVLGAILWVGSISTIGYLFGNLPWVKENFEKVVLGIVFISVLPIFVGLIKARMNKSKA